MKSDPGRKEIKQIGARNGSIDLTIHRSKELKFQRVSDIFGSESFHSLDVNEKDEQRKEKGRERSVSVFFFFFFTP